MWCRQLHFYFKNHYIFSSLHISSSCMLLSSNVRTMIEVHVPPKCTSQGWQKHITVTFLVYMFSRSDTYYLSREISRVIVCKSCKCFKKCIYKIWKMKGKTIVVFRVLNYMSKHVYRKRFWFSKHRQKKKYNIS